MANARQWNSTEPPPGEQKRMFHRRDAEAQRNAPDIPETKGVSQRILTGKIRLQSIICQESLTGTFSTSHPKQAGEPAGLLLA
jgi:hypothetical protein